jgi:xylulokinase
MYLLGFDIGSSSIKVSLVSADTRKIVNSTFQPKTEMAIKAVKQGWAEQNPNMWWENLKLALAEVLKSSGVKPEEIKAIGISYQMHGLVAVDKNNQLVRDSIIWCDSRAVEIGDAAFNNLGKDTCLSSLLNSPGNFTASKLRWVINNEPSVFNKIEKIMLPGDYIALRLTGETVTTVSGLSEGMMWDFKNNDLAKFLLDHYQIPENIIPKIAPTFSVQGQLTVEAANELGLKAGTVVSYRAGDQPNNALSLNVLQPGEIAATAGTSGVIYGVSDEIKFDPKSRVNTFAHVNHTNEKPRLGVLLCINGTGILNSWLKRNIMSEDSSYQAMNDMAASVPIGSEGLTILPFGNGAERVLENKNLGSAISNINFNIHSKNHILRAAQEGIVFSFFYGLEIMKEIGINPKVIKAGYTNMFQSDIFRDTLAGVSGASIQLYNSDGAYGAAIGAGLGAKIFNSGEEAFKELKLLKTTEPDIKKSNHYKDVYNNWKERLNKALA